MGLSQNKLRSLFEKLKNILRDAFKKRERVASAIGQIQSGAMEKWENEWNEDSTAISQLQSTVDHCLSPTEALSHGDLAKRTIEVDVALREVEELVNKYMEWDVWDKKKQAEIREERMAIFGAGRTSSPPKA